MVKPRKILTLAALLALPSLGATQTEHGGYRTSHQPQVAEMDHSSHGSAVHDTQPVEMDHSGHSMSSPAKPGARDHDRHQPQQGDRDATAFNRQTNPALPKLTAVPRSGKAREAGFDGRHAMEANAADEKSRCALASRGLLMLDNAEWAACGGKPEGASKTVVQSGGNNTEHNMDHAVMGH